VNDIIVAYGGELLRLAELFDVYTGDPITAGKRNLTHTIAYQAMDRNVKGCESKWIAG
jgi:phenylalanyl-tRNA synthetase beta chain